MDNNELRRIRVAASLSQWKVAVKLGRTQGWLSSIELGYGTPSPDVALKIEAAIKRMRSDSDR